MDCHNECSVCHMVSKIVRCALFILLVIWFWYFPLLYHPPFFWGGGGLMRILVKPDRTLSRRLWECVRPKGSGSFSPKSTPRAMLLDSMTMFALHYEVADEKCDSKWSVASISNRTRGHLEVNNIHECTENSDERHFEFHMPRCGNCIWYIPASMLGIFISFVI